MTMGDGAERPEGAPSPPDAGGGGGAGTGEGADAGADGGADGGPPDLTVGQAIELAIALHKRGFLDASEELYRRVLALDPDNVDALHFHGLVFHQLGRDDEAITE